MMYATQGTSYDYGLGLPDIGVPPQMVDDQSWGRGAPSTTVPAQYFSPERHPAGPVVLYIDGHVKVKTRR